MPWDGTGTFQRRVGAYVGDALWEAIRDAGRKIRADDADSQGNDFKAGLENCLTRDGQNAPSADLPMGGQIHTGVGPATLRSHYAPLGQVLDLNLHCPADAVSGTGDAIALTPSPGHDEYVTGMRLSFLAKAANTGAVTLNLSGLGAKSLTWPSGTALAANTLLDGRLVWAAYDGTAFRLVGAGEPSATAQPTTNAVVGILSTDTTVSEAWANIISLSITPVATTSIIRLRAGLISEIVSGLQLLWTIRAGTTDIVPSLTIMSGEAVGVAEPAQAEFYHVPGVTTAQTYYLRVSKSQRPEPNAVTLNRGSYLYAEEIVLP